MHDLVHSRSGSVSHGWSSGYHWSCMHDLVHSWSRVRIPSDGWGGIRSDSWGSDGVARSWSIPVGKTVAGQAGVSNAMGETVVGMAETAIAKTVAQAVTSGKVSSSERAGGESEEYGGAQLCSRIVHQKLRYSSSAFSLAPKCPFRQISYNLNGCRALLHSTQNMKQINAPALLSSERIEAF